MRTPVRPMKSAARSGVASSTLKVTGAVGLYGLGQLRKLSDWATRISINEQASLGAILRDEKRPRPVFTGAVVTSSPSSAVTSRQVASSPETNTAGTSQHPAMAARIPLSPTSVSLIHALYQASEETVWQSTPSGVPAMACAPTNKMASHPCSKGVM